jgi:hypothetical protein
MAFGTSGRRTRMVNVNCRVGVTSSLPCGFCQSPRIIFGVNPTKDAIVIARTTGSGEPFVIKTIKSIQFQARSGDDLGELLQLGLHIFKRLFGEEQSRAVAV